MLHMVLWMLLVMLGMMLMLLMLLGQVVIGWPREVEQ